MQILIYFYQNFQAPLLISNKYSELELVTQLKLKDAQAFSYLYDNYSAAIMGVIYKMTENTELSEDILQEVFIKIWNNFDNYDSSKGKLFTWMLNIARNLTIDNLRSKSYKKQQQIHGDENSVSNIEAETAGMSQFDILVLRKKIDKLKPEQKIIIDLAYFGGYTQDQIATETKIPLGTVKTRMRSAIIELRTLTSKF